MEQLQFQIYLDQVIQPEHKQLRLRTAGITVMLEYIIKQLMAPYTMGMRLQLVKMYALLDGMCQQIPSGQHLQIHWEVTVWQVAS